MAATQRARNKYMGQFSDTQMHMFFLGVRKHLMAHDGHLFGEKIEFLNIFAESYRNTLNLEAFSYFSYRLVVGS
jgi:hypothetical protein